VVLGESRIDVTGAVHHRCARNATFLSFWKDQYMGAIKRLTRIIIAYIAILGKIILIY
jgi:hypothetical protein